VSSISVNTFRVLSFFVSAILLSPTPSFAQEFDSDALGFGMPDIELSPASGPPGTKVEITVKNMPAPPEGKDPRIEFFVYLPFVTAIGSNVPNNCDGEHCFPLYSFDEVNAGKVAPKTITFVLFSIKNPEPTVQDGIMESVCDLKVNGVTVEAYSIVCSDNDQPPGEYEIKFAWGIQGSDLFDVRETVLFTVTEGEIQQEERVMDPDEVILEQYKNNEITEEEFEERLAELGYDAQELRRAKALIGKLPHQQGEFSPEQKQAIEEGIQKAEQEQREQTQQKTEPSTDQGGCLIATATFGSELSPNVQMLRELRDNVVFNTHSGTTFMTGFNEFYYVFSPAVADLERQNLVFRELVKMTITPMLSTLSILNYVEIDSEDEMLGYGIGVILLNLGMYFVVPALVVIRIKQHINKSN
jgi:hypothetical protein